MLSSTLVSCALVAICCGTPLSKVASNPLNARREYQTGSVSTLDKGGKRWIAPVTIGGQILNLEIDTGSADLWVFCTETPKSEQGGHNLYNPKKNNAKKLPNEQLHISYGNGSDFVFGDVYMDTVEIGGATVTSQAVACATSLAQDFIESTDRDGVLGLQFNSGSKSVFNGVPQAPDAWKTYTSSGSFIEPDAQETWMENAFMSLDEGVFTADLKWNEVGSYDFGFIDFTKFSGDVTWMPVTDWNDWKIHTSEFAIGDDQPVVQDWEVILDTGNPGIDIPQVQADIYYKGIDYHIDNSGWYEVSCDTVLPTFSLTFTPPPKFDTPPVFPSQSFTVVVASQNMIIQDPSLPIGTCYGGIQVTGSTVIALGDPFFESAFVIFDLGSSNGQAAFAGPSVGRVGLASKFVEEDPNCSHIC